MKRVVRLCALLSLGAFLASTYGCSGQQESKTIPYNDNSASPTQKGAGTKKGGGPAMPGP